jgi:hypothetical protein
LKLITKVYNEGNTIECSSCKKKNKSIVYEVPNYGIVCKECFEKIGGTSYFNEYQQIYDTL